MLDWRVTKTFVSEWERTWHFLDKLELTTCHVPFDSDFNMDVSELEQKWAPHGMIEVMQAIRRVNSGHYLVIMVAHFDNERGAVLFKLSEKLHFVSENIFVTEWPHEKA